MKIDTLEINKKIYGLGWRGLRNKLRRVGPSLLHTCIRTEF